MYSNILRAAIFTPCSDNNWGLPLILWGLPGTVKSAILKEIAAETGMLIEVLSPASRGEGAFGVTPVPVNDRMTYPRPDWTDKFEVAKRGIVFIDEINLAASHYAGALLGLAQDKVMGSYRFPAGVRMIAAANPIDLAAASGGWDLSAPAANRFGHLDWVGPTPTEWIQWLLGSNTETVAQTDPDTEESRVMERWPDAWNRACGIVAGFLSAHGAAHFHAMPPVGSPNLSKAWPSSRTWEYATRALASAQVHELSEDDRNLFVSAFIGAGSAGELFKWLASADLPNSADLLDGNLNTPWKHDPTRLDITMAVFSSATACVVQTKDRGLKNRRAESMWALLAQASESAPDLIVVPSRTLVQAKLMAGAIATLGKLNIVLEKAGIQVQ